MRRFVLLAVVTLLAGLLWWFGPAFLPPRQSDTVALPGGPVAPETVVEIYLAALNAHDCDAAASVTTSRDDGSGTARGWCSRVARLSNIEVGQAVPEKPAWSGNPPGTKVVRVPVSFDLQSRRFREDVSLPDGPTDWGYLLRRGADGSWQIFDQGMG